MTLLLAQRREIKREVRREVEEAMPASTEIFRLGHLAGTMDAINYGTPVPLRHQDTPTPAAHLDGLHAS